VTDTTIRGHLILIDARARRVFCDTTDYGAGTFHEQIVGADAAVESANTVGDSDDRIDRPAVAGRAGGRLGIGVSRGTLLRACRRHPTDPSLRCPGPVSTTSHSADATCTEPPESPEFSRTEGISANSRGMLDSEPAAVGSRSTVEIVVFCRSLKAMPGCGAIRIAVPG